MISDENYKNLTEEEKEEQWKVKYSFPSRKEEKPEYE